jgi:hypothetical protein
MRDTRILMLILMVAASLSLKAQQDTLIGKQNHLFVFFNAGADFIICSPPEDKEYIRGSVNTYPEEYCFDLNMAKSMKALSYRTHAEAYVEGRLLKNLLGVSAGIKYTRVTTILCKNDNWSGTDSKYLYFLYQHTGTTTEYLRLNSITQNSTYVGFPLELRVYPNHIHRVQVYYKLGADFNFLVSSQTHMDFFNKAMDVYEKEAVKTIEDPWKSYTCIYVAAGLKIGRNNKPGFNLEVNAPSFIMYNKNKSLVEPMAGIGVQLGLQLPL